MRHIQKSTHSQLAKVIKIFVRILYFIRFILSMYFRWPLKVVKAIMKKFLANTHSRTQKVETRERKSEAVEKKSYDDADVDGIEASSRKSEEL